MEFQIFNYRETKQTDGTFRLDAERYQKKYINNQRKLNNFGCVPLSELISEPVITGHTPLMKEDSYYGGNIKFVKTDNVREFKITGEISDYLTESGNEVIKRSSLKKGDLIVTIIGASHKIVGRAALVRDEDLPANINQNLALIRLSDKYSPEFLSTYLNSKIGKLALWYQSRQTEQVNLNCREVEKISVPKASDSFVKIVEKAYEEAVSYEHKLRDQFTNGEMILLKELGLTNWEQKHQLVFTKRFNKFKQSGRLDAGYYHPRYTEIIESIKKYRGGWELLGKLANVKSEREIPKAEKKYNYIELANIGKYGEITGHTKENGEDLPTRARRKVNVGDVIVSSVKGSSEKIALIGEEYDKAFCSTGFHVINSRSINSETLLMFFKSKIGQMLIKRGCSGTILMSINRDDFENIIIPKIREKTQIKIKKCVSKSVKMRRQSKQLLNYAKQALVMAIEKKEEKAIKWLNERIREANAD